jgi:hypothetical protein
MRLSRRASWLLIAFAVWSWIIWVTLIKNINNDPRSWKSTHVGQCFSRWTQSLTSRPIPAL